VTHGAATGAKLSRTELNVLQTMIVVIVCFIICWSPGAFTVFIELGIKPKVFCLSSILFSPLFIYRFYLRQRGYVFIDVSYLVRFLFVSRIT